MGERFKRKPDERLDFLDPNKERPMARFATGPLRAVEIVASLPAPVTGIIAATEIPRADPSRAHKGPPSPVTGMASPTGNPRIAGTRNGRRIVSWDGRGISDHRGGNVRAVWVHGVVAVAAEPYTYEHARRGERAGTGQKQQRKQFRFHNSSLGFPWFRRHLGAAHALGSCKPRAIRKSLKHKGLAHFPLAALHRRGGFRPSGERLAYRFVHACIA